MTGACNNIWTACVDYGDICGSNCQSDVSVKKWLVVVSSIYRDDAYVLTLLCNSPSNLPFCGTYSFFGGTYQYNCQPTVAFAKSVEFLNDFYATAIGSTLAGASTDPFSFSRTGAPVTVTKGSTSPTYTRESNNDAKSSTIGAAAIGGICAGVGVISIILGVIIFFCIRRRRNNKIKQAQQQTAAANAGYGGSPPMQQQSPGYQPVPQQDGQYLSPGQNQYPPSYPPTQQEYFDPSKTPATTYATPVSPNSTHDPRQSTFAGSGVTSPSPTNGQQQKQPQSPVLGKDSYYKPPGNPNTMEVDGTQGNPGIPHGGQQQFQEVDGTQGNPGVPHQQGQPHGPYEVQ